MSVHLLRLGTFLVFLGFGVALRLTREQSTRRRAINRFLACTLLLSALAGFTQWDDWPFSSHHVLVGRGRVTTSIDSVEFWATDAANREWRIDPYAWSPLVEMKLLLWYQLDFNHLRPDEQTRVLAFLLTRAESSRRELAAGRPIGVERRLGPLLAAPYWWIPTRPTATSPMSYVALRVYAAHWTPQGVLNDPTSIQRQLLVEYRP